MIQRMTLQPSTTPLATDPPTSTSVSGTRATKVKLPKIVLRKFDGSPLQWTMFWDSFKSTVHDNRELTEIDKFNYLHSLLERSAAEAISGLVLTSANYIEAIAILQKKYGDHQQIVSKHCQTRGGFAESRACNHI